MSEKTPSLKSKIRDNLEAAGEEGIEIVGDFIAADGNPVGALGHFAYRHGSKKVKLEAKNFLKRKFAEGKQNIENQLIQPKRRKGISFGTLKGQTMARKFKSNRKQRSRAKRRSKRKMSRKGKGVTKVPYPAKVLAELTSYHEYTMNPLNTATNRVAFLELQPNQLLDPINGANSKNAALVAELRPQWWDNYAAIYNKYEPLSCVVSVEFMASDAQLNVNYGIIRSSSKLAASDAAALNQDSNTTLLRTKYLKSGRLRMHSQINSSGGQNANHIVIKHEQNFKKAEGFKKSVGDGTQFVGITDAVDSGTPAHVAPTVAPKMYAFVSPVGPFDVQLLRAIVKIKTLVRFSERIQPTAVAVP